MSSKVPFSKRKVKMSINLDPTVYALIFLQASKDNRYCSSKGVNVYKFINDYLYDHFARKALSGRKEYNLLRKVAEKERQIWDQAYDANQGKCWTRRLKDYARM